MSEEIKRIVVTPGFGDEKFGQRLLDLGCMPLGVDGLKRARLVVRTKKPYGLVIPSLSLLDYYWEFNDAAIGDLIRRCVESGVARVGVISLRAMQVRKWEHLSNEVTSVKVEHGVSDAFFANVARFVAGLENEIN